MALLNLDIQPAPDLKHFFKKTVMPFEQGALRVDFFHFLLAIFGFLVGPTLMGFEFVSALNAFFLLNSYKTFWQRVTGLALDLVNVVGVGLYSCWMFLASPFYLLRLLSRSIITLIVGSGPSQREIIEVSLANNDLTALRNLPRLWFEKRFYGFNRAFHNFMGYRDANEIIQFAITNKQIAILQWLIPQMKPSGQIVSEGEWQLICQSNDTDAARIYFSHVEATYGANLAQGVVIHMLCPALKSGAMDVAKTILDHYPPIRHRDQYSFFTPKKLVDYQCYVEDIVRSVADSGDLAIIDLLRVFGLEIEYRHQAKILQSLCQRGATREFMSLQASFDFPVSESQPSLLYYACGAPTSEMFQTLVNSFALDPQVIKSPCSDLLFAHEFLGGIYAVQSTGLAMAISCGSVTMVQYLTRKLNVDTSQIVEVTSNGDAINNDKPRPQHFNALQWACHSPTIRAEMIECCMAFNHDFNARTPSGQTAFTALIQSGSDRCKVLSLSFFRLLSTTGLNLTRKVPYLWNYYSNGLLLLIYANIRNNLDLEILKHYLFQVDNKTLAKSVELLVESTLTVAREQGYGEGYVSLHVFMHLETLLPLVPWMIDPFRQILERKLPVLVARFDGLVEKYDPQPKFANSRTNTWMQLFHRSTGSVRPSTFTREMVQGYSGLSERQVNNRPS